MSTTSTAAASSAVSKTSSVERSTLPALDGLRGLAILLVVWCHLDGTASAVGINGSPFLIRLIAAFGFVGVFLFFNLSGFLLFLPYARALLFGSPWPSPRVFYLRRALRILPAYWFCLTILVFLHVRYLRLSPPSPGPLSLVAALLFDTRPSANQLAAVLDGPWWTLAIEWQFYLLLPWVALGLKKIAGSAQGRPFGMRIALGLGELIVIGLLLRGLMALLFYRLGQVNPIDQPGVLGLVMGVLAGESGKFWEVFALGMGASLLYVAVTERKRFAPHLHWRFGFVLLPLALLGLVGNIAWAAAVQRIPNATGQAGQFPDPLWSVLGQWSISLCFTAFMLAVLAVPWLRWLFSIGALRFIGKISYSIYLWHLPLLFFFLTPTISYARYVGTSVVVVLTFCTLSYLLLERPFLRWRRAPRQQHFLSPAHSDHRSP